MTHKILAILADAYTPLIAWLLIYYLHLAYKSSKQLFNEQLLLLGVLLCIVYGLMFLDNIYNLWPQLGLDYSTHSALACAIILSIYSIKRRFVYALTGSLLLYFGLMMYLKYHTLLDIISTLAAILFCYTAIIFLKKKK